MEVNILAFIATALFILVILLNSSMMNRFDRSDILYS